MKTRNEPFANTSLKDGKSDNLRDEYRKRSEQHENKYQSKCQINERKDHGYEPAS